MRDLIGGLGALLLDGWILLPLALLAAVAAWIVYRLGYHHGYQDQGRRQVARLISRAAVDAVPAQRRASR